MKEWIDITRPVDESLVTWPGVAAPARRWVKRIAAGHHCNASSWEMTPHAGTHMDAPLHFVDHGGSIDQIPPDVFLGDCAVIDLEAAGLPLLDEDRARRALGEKRLLVRTGHSRCVAGSPYLPHEPLMTEQAAALLLGEGLILIGTDRLSVDDSRGSAYRLHRLFLGAGCAILEGLLLAHVEAGRYFLTAAPLRVAGAEASPVRALLHPYP